MKRTVSRIITTVFCTMALAVSANAQQINTLYFLENTPMRHTINPAFQPVSNGYLSLPVIGYTGLWAANNSLSIADVVFLNPKDPYQTITVLHPDADKDAFLDRLRPNTIIQADVTTMLLGFGGRTRKNGYWTVNITERIDANASLPRSLFNFVLGGGMTDFTGGMNSFDLSGMDLSATVYTDIALGYSHEINEHWSVGGKLKVLLGTAMVQANMSDLAIDASIDQWNIHGNVDMTIAAPLNFESIQSGSSINEIITGTDLSSLLGLPEGGLTDPSALLHLIKPSGYGAAVDLGFTYRPFKFMQVNAAVTDLGFIHWTKTSSRTAVASMDTTFTGAGNLQYEDYVVDGKFSTDSLMSSVRQNVMGLLDAAHVGIAESAGFNQFLNMKLNVGLDFSFLNNRIGVGVLSRTRLVNKKIQEEVTVGVALKPFNWLNVAVSYSLLDNGHYSNIGAGLSIMPYDGLNITVAADYIPLVYTQGTPIPYHIKGVNAAIGLTFVWGTNHKKEKVVDETL
ncbi:MAG: DUF5723 family protein [Paludibacteraceae bacterium]